MTAGNRQGFIIINLRARIRIYGVTSLPPVRRPSPPSSAPEKPGGNARAREISFSIRD